MTAFQIVLEFINEKLWLAVFTVLLYIRSNPKLSAFRLKALLGACALPVLGLLPRLLYEQWPQNFLLDRWMECELYIWPILIVLYLRVLFSCNWNLMIFSAIAGLCTQEAAFGVWALLQIALHIPAGGVAELLVTATVSFAFAVGLYRMIACRITPRNLQTLQQRSLIPLLVLYVLAMLLISQSYTIVITLILFFEPMRQAQELAGIPVSIGRLRISGILTNVVGNLLVLLALRNMLRYSESDLERELLEQIREQDRKQYTHFRDNVDYINTKSHDLRHYMELLEQGQALPERELQQVSESLRNLDSETDSGNETLDLILTDRRIACERQGIDLIFQTDGTRLKELDVIDTYAVFCNILDNAIEYTGQLPQEKRRIRLGLRTIRDMVFIHQDNYFEGELEMKDGLPATTQEDELLHGFGLKSVRDTVKRRGGEMFVRTGSGRFELDICFPDGGDHQERAEP